MSINIIYLSNTFITVSQESWGTDETIFLDIRNKAYLSLKYIKINYLLHLPLFLHVYFQASSTSN